MEVQKAGLNRCDGSASMGIDPGCASHDHAHVGGQESSGHEGPADRRMSELPTRLKFEAALALLTSPPKSNIFRHFSGCVFRM